MMDTELFMAISKLMGWKLHSAIEKRPYDIWEDPEGVFGGEPPSWTDDWSAAGLVAERLVAEDWAFSMDYLNGPQLYDVHIYPSADMETWKLGRASTFPHAICLATLAAMEAGSPDD